LLSAIGLPHEKVRSAFRFVPRTRFFHSEFSKFQPFRYAQVSELASPRSLEGGSSCVNLIRYPDDFIITGRTKELLEGEVNPLVEPFLQAREAELFLTKTVIMHLEQV